MMKALGLALSFVLGSSSAFGQVETLPTTRIVGSSTVSPFASAIAQRLHQLDIDIQIETTGTGGGFSLFCRSQNPKLAPVTLASRPIRDKERDACAEAGITEITEYVIGRSGIVVAQAKTARPLKLGLTDIFQALATDIPKDGITCALAPNQSSTWRDVNNDLPNEKILFFGPPSTSGTRASFVNLALSGGFQQQECSQHTNKDVRRLAKSAAKKIRRDGRWIDAGENDSAILAAIARIPHSVGVLGYPLFARYADDFTAASIDGVTPTIETISNGSYPLSRELRIYVNDAALAENADAQKFLEEFLSEAAMGANGYLLPLGLIPPYL